MSSSPELTAVLQLLSVWWRDSDSRSSFQPLGLFTIPQLLVAMESLSTSSRCQIQEPTRGQQWVTAARKVPPSETLLRARSSCSSSGPSNLLLALHSPVLYCLLPRHNNTINLHFYLRSGVLCHFSSSLWYIPLHSCFRKGGGGGFWAGRRKTRWGRNMRECNKFWPLL